jgi:hypothetical protein
VAGIALLALSLAILLLLAPRIGREPPEERRQAATEFDTASGAPRDLELPASAGSSEEERGAPATSSARSRRGLSAGETVSAAATGSIAGQDRATDSSGDSGVAAATSRNDRRKRPDSDRTAASSLPEPDSPSATPAARTAAAQVPAGTTISLTSDERICTNTHLTGHRFSATVAEDVRSGEGVAIPAGSRAVVLVTSVDRSENSSDLGTIGLAVREIVVGEDRYPVDATITSAVVEQSGSKTSDATAVVGGAVAGAILGQVIGKDTKSTVVGAAAGAAAGSVIAMSTGGRAGCLPYRGPITIRLNTGARVVAN